jgi:elongation factor G
MHVSIHVPSEATANVNGVISSRRGRILGFDARQGWKGWDSVEAEIPQAELHNLIVELRSLTQGVGTYEQRFDHLAELVGKIAENVVSTRKAA